VILRPTEEAQRQPEASAMAQVFSGSLERKLWGDASSGLPRPIAEINAAIGEF
jgi:hypothetical protein